MTHRRHRSRSSRSVAGLASTALLAGLAIAGSPASATTPGDEPAAGEAAVEQQVRTELASGDTTTFWVYLREQADLSAAAGIADRADQGRFVYARLGRTAAASQARLVALLDAEGVEYETYWIANTVRVTGDAPLLERITDLPEVAQVTAERTYHLPEPAPAGEERRIDAVEWNIDRVGAAQVWDTFGVTGEDIVVGAIDSGVQFDHPALVGQYRGNRGDGSFDHRYNWYDPSEICRPSGTPCDNEGHGTHVTGTMVGDDGGDNRIGVAPGAQWIAAKGCETRNCSQSALLSAGQFMLAPTDLNGENARPELRPHIVNNSWGGDADDDPWYRPTVQAWVAAGIFPQFSSGNPGPACGQASNPGNLPESYAAGAFDINDNLYADSGRGPSAWGEDVVKPNIAAPGVAVRSAWNDGGYRAITGTSMASPHVAGTVALIWSAAPDVRRDIDATRGLLDLTAEDTEDLSCGGAPDHNNVWGQGKLDALAAVRESPRVPTGVLTGTVTAGDTHEPVAGATITITGEVDRRRTTGPDGGYSATLPVGQYDVTASAFAYQPRTAPVSILEGETTGQDFRLAAPDGPRLELAPDSLEFGMVAVGDAGEPLRVTVTSTGADPVTISEVPEPEAGFSHAGGTCGTAPFALPRLESCTLDLTFRPTVSGRTEATWTLVSDAPDSPHPVTLRGTATTAVGGAELWTARHHGRRADIDVAHALAVSPDGATAYVTGRSGDDTRADYRTVAYDVATGDERWAARYPGGGATAEARALAVSPDGARIYVTGWRQTGPEPSTRDYATVAYDAGTGAQLWGTRYDGPGSDRDTATAVGVGLDGATVFVTGGSRSGSTAGSTDYATVAYDAATGDQRWVARHDGPGDSQDAAQALAASLDGGTVFVAGSSRSGATAGTEDYATVAYDAATGDERWAARHDGPAGGTDRAEALGVSPARVFVTGASAGLDGNHDYATMAYDAATGDEHWTARYNGPASGDDAASALGVSPDGAGVFVTGGSTGAGTGDDYATVAYDAADGDQRWAARYDGPTSQPDRANALGVSPDGARVFVTGESGGGHPDYATVAYDADTGDPHWTARHDGPGSGDDAASALGVSPDGARVLVTGQSAGDGTDSDYATVAYRAVTSEITLHAERRRVQGVQTVDLSWAVTTRSDMDVFRDGELVATVPNTGLHTDTIGLRGPGSYTYEVCETGTSSCSNEATVRFGGPVPSGLMTYTHEGTGSGSLGGEPFARTRFVITAVADTDDVAEFLPFASYVPHLSASITIDGVGTFDFVSPTITGVEHLGQFGAPSVLFGPPDGTGGGGGVGLFWGPLDEVFGPWDLTTPVGPIEGEGFHIAWSFLPLETTGGALVFDDCFFTCVTAATFTAETRRKL